MSPEKTTKAILKRFHGRPAKSLCTNANDYDWLLRLITKAYNCGYNKGKAENIDSKVKIVYDKPTIRELSKASGKHESTIIKRRERGWGWKKTLIKPVNTAHAWRNK